MDELPKLEWVKLIPADSIPVFCFASKTPDADLEHIGMQLRRVLGDRKFMITNADVQIYAIAERTATQAPQCICGGEPHVSHCPANPDPFLRVIV